jgi:hypothetical protein
MREARHTSRIGLLGAVIIPAALFTAGAHVYLAVSPASPEPQLRVVFMLAALGYLTTLAALYAPLRVLDPVRWLARLGLLMVTVATIAAYFVVVGFYFDTLGLVDKAVEAVLALALVIDGSRAMRARYVQDQVDQDRGESAGRAAAA